MKQRTARTKLHVALLVGLVALASACGRTLSLDGDPDAEATADGGDAASDALAPADASGARFCADVAALFCESFDEPSAFGAWSMRSRRGAGMTLERSDARALSPPYSMLVTSPEPGAAGGDYSGLRLISKQFDPPLQGPLTVEFDFFVEEVPSKTNVTQPDVGFMMLDFNLDDPVLAQVVAIGYVRENTRTEIYPYLWNLVGPSTTVLYPGEWLHLRWTLTSNEEKLEVVSTRGTVRQSAETTRLPTIDSIGVGIDIGEGGGRWRVHYDNFVVRLGT